MDYEARLVKVEAQLEMYRNDIDRLYQAIDELRKLMLERFDRMELSIKEVREHADNSVNELRQQTNASFDKLHQYVDEKIDEQRRYTDHKFDELRRHTNEKFYELRQHTDESISELRKDHGQQMQTGFAEIRREASINMRWMMGMWLTTIGFIAGLGGRVFGVY